jgi:putative nucleotidyltransferase with HDIG domain
VDAFQRVQTSEAFWIALVDRHITRYTWDMGQIESSEPLSLPQLRQLSLIMSYVVDQKSPFTAQHSVRVADLARYLAAAYGLSEAQCGKIEIAGLLHDLGKLHIPDDILEKAGPLTDFERSIMNQHSYETYEILRQIKGLEEVALWAAYHHEGLNGGGYPFHPRARDLSIEARILAVADVFQALVQDRPYRSGMPLQKVLDALDEMADRGKLDRNIVKLAKENGTGSYRIARGEDEIHN